MKSLSRELVLRGLRGIRNGGLELRLPGGAVHRFGNAGADLNAVMDVHDERAFSRAVGVPS